MLYDVIEEKAKENIFQDELCNQYIEKISYLQSLIAIEEKKLFEAMKRELGNEMI